MKTSTRNQAKGKLHDQGHGQGSRGEDHEGPRPGGEGAVEKTLGKVQKKVGDLGKVFEK